MKFLAKCLLLSLCVLILGCVTTASAESVAEEPLQQELEFDPSRMEQPQILVLQGEVVEREDGKVAIGTDDPREQVVALLGDSTYILDGRCGKAKKVSALRKGRDVTLYYSPIMTRSLPPQSQAFAIVLGKIEDGAGRFFQVEQAVLKDGYIELLSVNHDLILTVDASGCKNYADIRKGDKLLYWASSMTLSLPAQSNAEKVVLLQSK